MLILVATTNNIAIAKISSIATRGNAITTLGWGNIIAAVGSPEQSGSYHFNWANGTGAEYTYVDLVNVGDVTTTGNSIAVSTKNSSNSTSNAPRLTFATCSGSWNQSNNSCSGSIMSLGNVTNGTLDVTLTLTASSRRTLRVAANKTRSAVWTSTMSVAVTRSHIRNATTTNS
jgi:hypothetical protein